MSTVFYAGPSPYDHTDQNNAMVQAIKIISGLLANCDDLEETALSEARETLRLLDTHQNATSWLIDRLTQATIDYRANEGN